VARLRNFGVTAEIRREWASDVGTSFDVSFQGPLYDGQDRSKGKVRIDINRRPEEVTTRRELVTSEYDDVRPFVVTVLTPEHLMAEKIRALLVRGKPRDLYDIWLLLNQGVQPDDALIERKLALYGTGWDRDALAEALDRVRTNWKRDLQHLLPQFVPYEVARDGVEARLG
jgi:predicted nucleotidyltransferase component of viral defense system